MWADLGSQRQHLGAVEAGPRGVQLGKLDLARGVAGDFADGAEHPRCR
jgi:hypothetical protein